MDDKEQLDQAPAVSEQTLRRLARRLHKNPPSERLTKEEFLAKYERTTLLGVPEGERGVELPED